MNASAKKQDFSGEDDEPTDPGIRLRGDAPQNSHSPTELVVPTFGETAQAQAAPPAQVPRAAPLPNLAPPPPMPPAPAVKMPDLGAIESFMKDPGVSEIMVNDLRNVMIEREGKLQFSGFRYEGLDELNRLVRTILDTTGRILSPDSPYVDVVLPDGSRVNIVGAPLTLAGPCLTIRKFPLRRQSLQELIQLGALDQRMGYFLNVCVVARINILVSGGTGSGKTTLLNALASLIPKSERIVTIEDTPELLLPHANSVRIQTKPQTPGSGPVGARELVANALRMRPDRIIVGECRRGEAFDMLQAMNTGHEGSMTTLHSNSHRDALARLETLCLLSGVEIPLLAIRKQIASAIDLVVQIRRFRDGKRRVVSISEVTGMEGEVITTQDLFAYESGSFRSHGLVPTFVDRVREHGYEFPQNFFS